MIAGHFGFAAIVKSRAPAVPLWALMLATVWLDIVFVPLFAAGIETLEPAPGVLPGYGGSIIHAVYTHSLVGAVLLSGLLGLAATAKWGRRAGLIIGMVSFSHWLLDLIVHRPDLPLYPGSTTMIGLGLWNSVPATLAVECAMFAAGVWLYASHSRPLDRAGRYGFWAFVAFLVAVYAANAFGPPPPSVGAVAFAGLALWLLPLWAWWFDSRRAYSRSCTG